MDSERNAKLQHRGAVLGLLHSGVHLTRGQMASRLGITRSTISEVLTDLQDEGAVVVSEVTRSGGRGRPAEVLCANPGAARYIAVDYSHTRVMACIANSTGQVIASGTSPYSPDDGWERRCRAGIELVRGLEGDDVHFGALGRIAIGLPGPNSATWDSGLPSATRAEPFHMVSARIRELFSQAFGVGVMVDHHIRLAALAEASAGRSTAIRNLVYLRMSTGIGGAVISSGSVAQGAHQQAGEIGHFIVELDDDALECRCGRRGCLETVASIDALARDWAQLKGQSPDRAAFEAAAADADPDAVALLEVAAQRVGRVLAMAVLVSDPGEVVLAGEVVRYLPDFVERVQAALWPSVLSTQHVPVRHSNLGEEAGAIGGIVALMAQQRATEPQKEASMSPNRLEVTGAPRVG